MRIAAHPRAERLQQIRFCRDRLPFAYRRFLDALEVLYETPRAGDDNVTVGAAIATAAALVEMGTEASECFLVQSANRQASANCPIYEVFCRSNVAASGYLLVTTLR
jgi:hypothetical protein